MFQNWNFLIGEIFVLLLLAALLGLLIGWLIWGRRDTSGAAQAEVEVARLKTLLRDCEAARSEVQAEAERLRGDIATAQMATEAEARDSVRGPEGLTEDSVADDVSKSALASEAGASLTEDAGFEDDYAEENLHDSDMLAGGPGVGAAATGGAGDLAAEEAGEDITPDFDGDGVLEGADEGEKPALMSEARAGGPDNLKEIKGVGPKLETLLHSMGVFHFDQIAAWTDQEVAWVDANLKGFKGRVSRDNWVEQAKILATGAETEFSQRVQDGDVY